MKTFKVILLIMVVSLFSSGLIGQVPTNATKVNSNRNISSTMAIPTLDLLSTSNFDILAYSTITGLAPVTIVGGDVGLSPTAGSAITGFDWTSVTGGTIYTVGPSGPAGKVTDAARLTTAMNDLTTAYNDARDRVPVPTLTFLNPGAGEIGGMNLPPGLYKFTAAASITGSDLTLTGTASDVWIFQIGSSLDLGSSIKITLAGGAVASNIFWQVGSTATLGTYSVFKGTILAHASVVIGTGATIDGRAFAATAAVTMGSAVTITKPGLANTTTIPTLINPINTASNISTSPVLTWSSEITATSYMLQVATNSGFINPMYSQSGLTSAFQQVTGLSNDSVYYWRVRSQNSTGVSGWSTVWSFSAITAAPNPPILISPSNTAANIASNPTFSWNASTGATSYTMQVASDIGFTNLVYNHSGLTSTSQQITGLSNNAVYYWRVNAANIGGTGAWSTIWSFSTLTIAPNAPTLATPLNHATGVAYNPTLNWNASDRATSYTMQIATDSEFNNIVKIANGVNSTSQIVIALSNNTTYYWRVYGYNSGGASPWSSTWSFTTISTLLQTLDLRSTQDFVILAGSTVTAVPPVTIRGNVGLSPAAGSFIVGFNGSNVNGTLYVVDANGPLGSVINAPLLTTAKGDLTIAYNDAANRTPVPTGTFLNPGSGNIGGLNLVPGLYKFTSDAGITGSDVTLTGSATDIWIFQIVSSLNVGNGIHVILAGGAQAANIFWQVGSSATLGTNSVFKGTIMADQSITFGTSANFEGRALAFTGAVTLGAGATATKPGLIDLPTPPTLIAPINNAINVSTNPVHVWNASTGASSYTLQVARDNGFTNMVYNQSGITSTNQQVNGLLSNMLYYWRVNALNSGGTSVWSSIWSYTITTFVSAPSAPTLSSPANTSTDILSNPTLVWNSSTGATSYTLQVATDIGFANLVYNQSVLTATSQQVIGLNSNRLYYWRVNAANTGGTSAWSAAWSFTVTTFPSAPVLSCPANTATGISINPLFCWIASTGATSYTLQLATDNGFTNLVYNQSGISLTTQQVNGLLNNTLYYWRANAFNAFGTSNWSSVWTFTTTIQLPDAPVLINPANNAYNISLTPVFSWEMVNGVWGYDLQISKISDFSTIVSNQTGLTATNYSSSSLDLNSTYYWRVRSKNSAGNSLWSTGMFKTKQTLMVPILTLPANNSRSNSVDVTFSWSRIDLAVNYELMLSKYSDFRNNVANPNTIPNPTTLLSGLENSATYYWKVRVIGDGEISDWSQTFSFTTPSNILAPSLIYPENNSYGMSSSLAFSWGTVATANNYEMQLSTDRNFVNTVSNYTGITTPTQSVTGIASNTTLYWKVRAIKDGYSGNWSEVWSFKTASPSLTTPVITYPLHNSTNIPINPTLKWNAVSGATGYETVLSDKSDMSNVLSAFILGSPSSNISNLANNKTYYWKVIARNEAATSEWTTIYKFTTLGTSVGVQNIEGLAESYSLSQNYPNPFNPSTVITYTISEPSFVTIKIFNVFGAEIQTLVSENHSIGKYSVAWEPKNITSGVYYYQLKAGKYNEVRKMVYIR